MVGTGRFELPIARLTPRTPRVEIGGIRCGECRVGALAVGSCRRKCYCERN
jgi:hypothetical protein